MLPANLLPSSPPQTTPPPGTAPGVEETSNLAAPLDTADVPSDSETFSGELKRFIDGSDTNSATASADETTDVNLLAGESEEELVPGMANLAADGLETTLLPIENAAGDFEAVDAATNPLDSPIFAAPKESAQPEQLIQESMEVEVEVDAPSADQVLPGQIQAALPTAGEGTLLDTPVAPVESGSIVSPTTAKPGATAGDIEADLASVAKDNPPVVDGDEQAAVLRPVQRDGTSGLSTPYSIENGTPERGGELPTLETDASAINTTSLDGDSPLPPSEKFTPQDIAAILPPSPSYARTTSIAASSLAIESTVLTGQVVDHVLNVSHSVEDGKAELQVQLDPPELGKITIELTEINDSIKGKLIVSSYSTLDSLRDNLTAITDSLAEMGLSMDDFQLEGSQSEQSSGRDDEQGARQESPWGLAADGETTGPAAQLLGSHRINVLA